MSSPLLSSKNNYDYDFIRAGAYGEVFKITSKQDKKSYAMKQIQLKNVPKSQRLEAFNEAKNEYNLYKKNIPNVLRSYGSHFDQSAEIYRFSVDLMETDLYRYIDDNGALTFEKFAPIFSDIIKGKSPFDFLF
jgi:serine/threonine protein kinase